MNKRRRGDDIQALSIPMGLTDDAVKAWISTNPLLQDALESATDQFAAAEARGMKHSTRERTDGRYS